MKWFYDLKIAAKLIIGFVVVAMIAGVVGVVGMIGIVNMNEMTQLYVAQTNTIPDLANIARTYQRERVYLYELYLEKDENKRLEIINNLRSCDEIIDKNMQNFSKGSYDAKVEAGFDKLSQLIEEFSVIRDEAINYEKANQMEKVYEVMNRNQTNEIEAEIQSITDELIETKTQLAKDNAHNFIAYANNTVAGMLLFIVLGMFIAISLGFIITRVISNPIKEVAEAANQLALGDVTVDIKVRDTKDETGRLLSSFMAIKENISRYAMIAEKIAGGDMTIDVIVHSEKDLLGKKLAQMVKGNNEVLSNINSSAEKVALRSKQISDASINLSQGAVEQASAIEELTTSLEEISSQTKLNAQNADNANALAVETKSNALHGNSQMKEMLRAMEEINESSAKISKVIKVIDDIAFQTNILALNAAVEAARAGTHGKGFAVVAEEVRNLAERSANAAKETTGMIEGSIKKSEDGTKIAVNTAQALDEIVNDIEKVANLISDIASASNEQAIGISQINQGIMQVSEVIQNNSITSEKGVSASEELLAQANILKEMIGKYKLDNSLSNSKKEEVSKEVLDMINKMSEKKKPLPKSKEKAKPKKVDSKTKILLSDHEFGKY